MRFFGFFGKSNKDGNYYLQSGHTDYRIFRLDGLAQATRGGGKMKSGSMRIGTGSARSVPSPGSK